MFNATPITLEIRNMQDAFLSTVFELLHGQLENIRKLYELLSSYKYYGDSKFIFNDDDYAIWINRITSSMILCDQNIIYIIKGFSEEYIEIKYRYLETYSIMSKFDKSHSLGVIYANNYSTSNLNWLNYPHVENLLNDLESAYISLCEEHNIPLATLENYKRISSVNYWKACHFLNCIIQGLSNRFGEPYQYYLHEDNSYITIMPVSEHFVRYDHRVKDNDLVSAAAELYQLYVSQQLTKAFAEFKDTVF